MAEYSFHSFANIFPMMSEEQFSSLVEDIKRAGLREKIWLFQGQILDGRNRYLACLKADIFPQFREFTGTENDALGAVLSWNLERRHLDTSERAMIGARIKPMFEDLAKKRLQESGRFDGRHSDGTPKPKFQGKANLPYPETRQSRDDAAKAVNVSPRSVEQASKVLKSGSPELIKSVDEGKASVSAAAQVASLPVEDQAEIVAKGEAEIIRAANKIRTQKRLERSQQRDEAANAVTPLFAPNVLIRTHAVTISEGETITLGKHSLTCGDSSEWRPSTKAKMIFADPPYNAGVDHWDSGFTWQHDWIQDWADYALVTPGTSQLQAFLSSTQMNYRWMLTVGLPGVYGRHSAIGTSNTIQVLLFSNLKSVHIGATDYFTCSYENQEKVASTHKGRKPSKAIAWLVQTFTNEGDRVVDPFLGSGTTLLVADQMGRVCNGCEINRDHCQEIIDRYHMQQAA